MMTVDKGSGWFLTAEFMGRKVDFLIDSGASCSLISSAMWSDGSGEKVRLRPSDLDLSMADGSYLEVAGDITENLSFGDQKFSMDFSVAALGGLDGLLGLDFLKEQRL